MSVAQEIEAEAASQRIACEGSVRAVMDGARKAQAGWGGLGVERRLRVLREFRRLLVNDPSPLLDAVRRVREVSAAEIVVSELVPLADACRFLEDEAEKILAPRPAQGRRPLWLAGCTLKVCREPLGVVLIVGPSNYPLLIAGVQVLQALAAGNTVIVKPGRGAGEVMRELRSLLVSAGVEGDAVTVLDDNDEQRVRHLVAGGVDKLLLTGSSRTGVAMMEAAAHSLTPSTMELSGCDAAFVLSGADAALAAKALVFGLMLNHSRTCMRPHRVLVHDSLRDELAMRLAGELGELEPWAKRCRLSVAAKRMLAEAMDAGAKVVMGSLDDPLGFPMVIEGVDGRLELAHTDGFVPVLILQVFSHIDQALRIYDECAYALGASVFGPERDAEKLAGKINAGFVVINDVIAPTADPRLPFSGRKHSGFGSTRGAQGLLELKAVATRKSNYRHLDPVRDEDKEFFLAYLQMVHGTGLGQRMGGAVNLVRAGMRRSQARSR